VASRLPQLLADAKREGWAQWIRSPADEQAVLNGCWFDPKAADHVCEFFPRFLRHSKGEWAGKPYTLLEWQSDGVLRPLFGWKRKDGARRYRQGYVEIPKKNGKSALCSGLVLYMLVADGERGAEVYSAAADRNQASIVYNEAANMVEQSPDLKRALQLVRSVKRIVYPGTSSWFSALSADVPTKEGLNMHFGVFDELHAQRTSHLFDAIRYAGAARRQPMLLSITTAGYDTHTICWEQHEYAEGVSKGTIEDESFFGYIRAAALEDDWTSPETWQKANPSLGHTITLESFEADCREAIQKPRKMNSFKRYRLNIWTQAETAWLRMDRWDAPECKAPIDAEVLRGQRCWLGLDLSRRSDITAMVAVFRQGEVYTWLPHFWIPQETMLEKEREDQVPYAQWVEEGYITATPGDVIDYKFIQAMVEEWCGRFDVQEIPHDPWGAAHLAQLLMDEGLPVVEFRQGFKSFSEPSKKLEELVLSGLLRHGGNPVLRWMADNCAIEMDPAENIKPSKRKSTRRIDGIVAGIMGTARAMMDAGESVYDERGVIFV
jgi:phage terminase large subunit-like protein